MSGGIHFQVATKRKVFRRFHQFSLSALIISALHLIALTRFWLLRNSVFDHALFGARDKHSFLTAIGCNRPKIIQMFILVPMNAVKSVFTLCVAHHVQGFERRLFSARGPTVCVYINGKSMIFCCLIISDSKSGRTNSVKIKHTRCHDTSLSAKQNEMLDPRFVFVQRSVPILRQTNLNFITFLHTAHTFEMKCEAIAESTRPGIIIAIVISSIVIGIFIGHNRKLQSVQKKKRRSREKASYPSIERSEMRSPDSAHNAISTVKVLLNRDFY